MKIKTILKRILKGFLIILATFIVLMLIPRTIGFLFPEKAPIAYHFELLDYLAIGVGLEKMADLKPEIPATIEEIKDIEYKNVGGKSLHLDIYKPKELKEPSPLLVFIHGGAWRHGQRSDYLGYLVNYAEKGYMTATVSYRLDTLYPACVEDIADAVDWLFKNGESYGVDTSRIALIGGSAGGHLSLLSGYNWINHQPVAENDTTVIPMHKVKAVVDIYGPVDLTTPYASTQPLVTRFIGHPYTEKPELYWDASPAKYLHKDLPATLIFQGTSDMLVPTSQSDTLKARLDRLVVPCEYYKLPLWPHAMDIALRPNQYMQKKMDAFFEKYLK
jgi:acetyl esterase/lipase